MIQIHIKNYNELTKEELYGLLQLRSQVFVVEQNCVYQDIDGKDQKSLHVLGKKDNVIIAYSRIFKKGDYFKESSIGRVVVDKNSRHHQYGTQIMHASIEAIQNTFHTKIIKISAQLYLENFYTGFGFKPTGNSYLEDGIPHVAMIKN